MANKAIPILVIAAIMGGIIIAAAMTDPHDQIVAGIKAAKEACERTPPKTDYERKVCALVAP